MTIEEFDGIRPFLPANTEVILKMTIPASTSPPKEPPFESALRPEDSSVGRFRMTCFHCGYVTPNEYLSSQRDAIVARLSYKPCPNCGQIFDKNRRKGI